MFGLSRVMIVAGESSGELYGSLLARTLRERNPGVEIRGVGGERMEAAGVSLISRIASSFGITEAVKTYGQVWQTFRQVFDALSGFNPQVLVLIDYPDFNLRVAKKAKAMGIRVLYYVSPQVWAWRKGRIKTIGKVVDRMAVILPFEEAIYRERQIPCEFVGHPVMDEIREVGAEVGRGQSEDQGPWSMVRGVGAYGYTPLHLKKAVRQEFELDHDRPVIAVMPGSRPHEIMRLLPALSGAMQRLRSMNRGYQFILPLAPNLDADLISLIRSSLGDALIIKGDSIKALMASDMAVIASGTSTLQATLMGVPAVVVYRLSGLSYFIGKRLIRVRHIALVNVILDHLAGALPLRIKELIQDEAGEEAIVSELMKIEHDEGYRLGLNGQMETVSRLFSGKFSSLRVAEMAEELGGRDV
ncbi:MAG: hypothetical protein WC291_11795 [Thermodesulfovibrionales bacterium]|jgi:lipid-A-disaccharide synthase